MKFLNLTFAVVAIFAGMAITAPIANPEACESIVDELNEQFGSQVICDSPGSGA